VGSVDSQDILENILLFPGIKLRLLGHPVTIPNKLFRLPSR